MFTILIENHYGILSAIPEGRLDTINSSVFNEQLAMHLESEKFLIIDFGRCNYLASSGIRSLMSADRQLRAKGGRIILANLPPEVFQVLEISGLTQVFSSYDDSVKAREAITILQKPTVVMKTVQLDGLPFTVIPPGENVNHLAEWNVAGIAGLNELGVSVGVGSPAESLTQDNLVTGIFATVGNCSGFLPFAPAFTSEYRVFADPAAGGVFVDFAVSAAADSAITVRLPEKSPVSLEKLIDAGVRLSEMEGEGAMRLMAIADRQAGHPDFTLVLLPEKPGQYTPGTAELLVVTPLGYQVNGLTFTLDGPGESSEGDIFTDFCRKSLTLDNISGVKIVDLARIMMDPLVWMFSSSTVKNAGENRISVQMDDGSEVEPWKAFLTRRLYTDSSRVVIKPLHGGYSAQTFQVESFDLEGRKLRPTVLKIAGRDLINREGDRCQRYAMPYILNNSAIILGTSFFCTMGALRYNFVGIGGEETRLEWLARYFHTWQVDQLEILFDKIFLQILKPWYGQPVKKAIQPYTDHDPTLTFFKTLCETAEAELNFPSTEKYLSFHENGRKLINPYWYLRNEYPARRNDAINYYTAVCHGDLNMQNILLDAGMNVYLIDFSETKPRSAISDFARLEAIFIIEHAPLDNESDLSDMMDYTEHLYNNSDLGEFPEPAWKGSAPAIMARNIAMVRKMRDYALQTVEGERTIIPYYLALLEWVLPIVCYEGAGVRTKRLSAWVSGLLCRQVMQGE
jgi:anti-anti-sigma factor